jgi:hypothetical protein
LQGVFERKNLSAFEDFVPDSAVDCLPMVGFYGPPGREATECPPGRKLPPVKGPL